MTENGGQERPEQVLIEYPSDWKFTVIGQDEGGLRQAVEDVVGDREHGLESSRESSAGKYVSMKLTVRVETEEERNGFHERLKDHAGVKLVL